MAAKLGLPSGYLRIGLKHACPKNTGSKVILLLLVCIAVYFITLLNGTDKEHWKEHPLLKHLQFSRFQQSFRDHCLFVTNDIIPNDEHLREMSLKQLKCLYKRQVTSLQSLCMDLRRYGNVQYGGFYICMDKGVAPIRDCAIYSFNHDLSERFVAQMEVNFNCKVVFFGQNILAGRLNNVGSFNRIFANIREEISVAILKINQYDFPFLVEFCNIARRLEIRQIILEIHYDPRSGNKTNFINLLSILRSFNNSNYVIYSYDRNLVCVQEGNSVCFTVNMYLSYQMKPQISNRIHLPNIEPFGSKPMNKSVVKEYERVFLDYISKHQILCKHMVRMGNIEDGGWDVCHDLQFRPRSPCIVYSFGIAYDFSFDDDVERTYGCSVFSFDPSMNMADHNRTNHIKFLNLGIGEENKEIKVRGKLWKLETLKTIQEKLGHTNKRIDILKMDIEENELQTLPEMIRSGAMENVAQFCLEFHSYYDIGTLRELHDLGFRIYLSHQNPTVKLYENNHHSYSSCNEVYFININMKN